MDGESPKGGHRLTADDRIKGGQNSKRPKMFANQLKQELDETDGIRTHLEKIISALVKEATKGNIAAIKEVADRVDGRSKQSIDIEHEEITVRFIDV